MLFPSFQHMQCQFFLFLLIDEGRSSVTHRHEQCHRVDMGPLGTKASATIFHSVMCKLLRSEIGNDDLADDVSYRSVALSWR